VRRHTFARNGQTRNEAMAGGVGGGRSGRRVGACPTDREVKSLLGNIRLRSFATRDEQEVAGHADVMDPSSTLTKFRQLHRDHFGHSTKDERHRCAYKTLSNNVEAFKRQDESLGMIFETASPFDTPRRMQELIGLIELQ
jgi:hypothetical protein